MKDKGRRTMRLRTVLVLLTLALSPVPAMAQKIGVKSATPASGEQGSVGLDVVIAGTGFGPGAQARFVLSGTDNPDGVAFYEAVGMARVQVLRNFHEVVARSKPGHEGDYDAIEFEWLLG